VSQFADEIGERYGKIENMGVLCFNIYRKITSAPN